MRHISNNQTCSFPGGVNGQESDAKVTTREGLPSESSPAVGCSSDSPTPHHASMTRERVFGLARAGISQLAHVIAQGVGQFAASLAPDTGRRGIILKTSELILGRHSQAFQENLRGYLDSEASDSERRIRLCRLDLGGIVTLQREIQIEAGRSRSELEAVHGVILQLLEIFVDGVGDASAYKRRMARILLKIHPDHRGAQSKDFESAYLNRGRDLVLQLALLLHRWCGETSFQEFLAARQQREEHSCFSSQEALSTQETQSDPVRNLSLRWNGGIVENHEVSSGFFGEKSK